MTIQELLYVQAMEECAEVAARISKALRFGLDECEPGQASDNLQRIRGEVADLIAVLDMAGIVKVVGDTTLLHVDPAALRAKRAKVHKYIAYSQSCQLVDVACCETDCDGYVCTLKPGHDGEHVAGGSNPTRRW
jgi:hypothetical protein